MSAKDNSIQLNDDEKKEWLKALDAVIAFEGSEYAQSLLTELSEHASQSGLAAGQSLNTPYINSIAAGEEAKLPDDGKLMEKLTNAMRWNAICMVMRAGHKAKELGGHIASFAAAATLYEVGNTYFFNGANDSHGGDSVYFQGHSSPGMYARAFLEGHLSEHQLDQFRQEIDHPEGLASYPHPWLMPDFWQFATVSMGLGPLMAIYQAQFLKYLHNRGLAKADDRHIWAYCGDGEMGEVESLGGLNIAGRDGLDNLVFVISCNLQRLDGPVWGDGQIIQEYERVYRGAGWHVIKVIWGESWQQLFDHDSQGVLRQRISELVDGEYQNYGGKDGAYMRENFFNTPELKALVADQSDEDLKHLLDGGHDVQKVFAAFHAAVEHKGQPVVILAKTVKGWGMGASGEAQNKTHQQKKMSTDDLKLFRDRFELPLTDKQVEDLEYYKPADDSAEMKYLHAQREKLGGYLPRRRQKETTALKIPDITAFQSMLDGTGEREISTAMAFVRCLSAMLKDKNIKDHIVPILADESRTFGMEGLFRQIGIYAPRGQQYTPEDKNELMYYREDKKGQLLQQGINEAGAMASWIAAATSYSHSDVPMIPFYVYYSMFGFQRVGDFCWAAGDMRSRGFIMGGTAGKTTLAGEGLQHQDGHNILMFDMVPNCICYDPTFSYELAVILHDGMIRMYQNHEDVYYYITLMNENYQHPAMPKDAEADIIKGMYQLQKESKPAKKHVQLMGSGTILREAIAAADILKDTYGVTSDVWSVTSFTELYREWRTISRLRLLQPDKDHGQSHVESCMKDAKGPVIAVTDYIRLFADQIRESLDRPYYALGTDGFGRSDTRVALRDYFEVDAKMVVYTALKALHDDGEFTLEELLKARKDLDIDPDHPEPVSH
ncbi:MAG: pyruvate dehydrogenase (acetyl-transferring), homodimeric type [Coxiellaceae bacterium]|nr:pyruvate dehydrogenase (acetyl-transferring), homodimeric type [Coxiellaceae bacterium]